MQIPKKSNQISENHANSWKIKQIPEEIKQIPKKIRQIPEKSGKFLKNSGNSWKIPEIPEKIRKFRRNSGNSVKFPEFPEKFRKFSKNVEIFKKSRIFQNMKLVWNSNETRFYETLWYETRMP